jgi:hypothetical protein
MSGHEERPYSDIEEWKTGEGLQEPVAEAREEEGLGAIQQTGSA